MSLQKTAPQNIEAEQYVLGAAFLEPDSILKAADIIQPDDFFRDAHRLIYMACLDTYHHEELNIISICEYLKSRGELEKCGGGSYIAALIDSVPTAANIGYYAKLVRRKAILRRTLQWAYSVQEKIYNGLEDIRAFFNDTEKEFISLSDNLKQERQSEISAVITSLKQRWQDEKTGLKKFIETDSKFSKAIPRYAPGHLWIIGGYTSAGKSTLLAQLIADMCSEGAKTIVFSLEDSREDKAVKLLANLAYMGQTQLMTGHVDDPESQRKLPQAEETLKSWNLHIYDDVYNVDEMRLKIKKHKLQGGANAVCVDFIQNIGGEGTLYERISDAIIKLQQMAREFEVTMIVVSQVSNEAMRSNSEIIGLKGAGELSAAADIILWLKRVKGEGNEKFLNCEIRKNRPFGVTCVVELAFNEMWSKILKRNF